MNTDFSNLHVVKCNSITETYTTESSIEELLEFIIDKDYSIEKWTQFIFIECKDGYNHIWPKFSIRIDDINMDKEEVVVYLKKKCRLLVIDKLLENEV